MKSSSQIKKKLRQVIFRHRQKAVRSGMSVRPCNCSYNELIELRTPNKIHGIRKCTFSNSEVNWDQRVCDEGLNGLKQAQDCPFYSPKNTPESLKRDFDVSVGLDGNKVPSSFLASKYPDIMALSWVLRDSTEEDPPLQFSTEEETSEYLLFMSSFLNEDEDKSVLG